MSINQDSRFCFASFWDHSVFCCIKCHLRWLEIWETSKSIRFRLLLVSWLNSFLYPFRCLQSHHAQLVARLWTAGNCCVLEVQCKWLQWFGFQFHLLLNELSVKYFIHVSALPAVTAAKHTSEHEIRYSDCSHLRGVVRAVNAFSINWEPGSVHFNPLEINGKGKKCTDLIRSLYLSWISACTRLRMLP